MATRAQLRELIDNLVQNAIEAMAAIDGQRVLKVRTELASEDILLLSIQDSGPGVRPEKVNAIFDAFVTTKSHGRGLGLALCRIIVQRHSGQLSVVQAKPCGATFPIRLPASV